MFPTFAIAFLLDEGLRLMGRLTLPLWGRVVRLRQLRRRRRLKQHLRVVARQKGRASSFAQLAQPIASYVQRNQDFKVLYDFLHPWRYNSQHL